MVDLNDIKALEAQQKAAMSDDVYAWGMKVGLHPSIRASTVHQLYNKYSQYTNYDLVRKMVRSKTGLNDMERAVHEQIITLYPEWEYEVPIPPLGSSIDFIGNITDGAGVQGIGRSIIEVKTYSSWKQSTCLLLYHKYFPDCNLVTYYFGECRKKKVIITALNELGIYVGEYAHGKLGLFEENNIPDEF